MVGCVYYTAGQSTASAFPFPQVPLTSCTVWVVASVTLQSLTLRTGLRVSVACVSSHPLMQVLGELVTVAPYFLGMVDFYNLVEYP